MYAIIDIETTGSRDSDKITEIAIYIHNGEKITDEFISLVNPEVPIPYFIIRMTGISNEMVKDAPKFYEIAKKIVEITTNKIIIAHNSSFDYNFIRNEFKSLGFDFKRKHICTVKLTRKHIPSLPSYSLGKLCDELGIELNNRHRASGDALATVKLFELLLSLNENVKDLFAASQLSALSHLNPHLDKELIEKLPEETGIYFFYDERKELIYVGKSRNIYNRVMSHFGSCTSKKAINLRDATAQVDYELTGNELIALLLESHQIKLKTPLFNRAQRRNTANYALYTYFDEYGYQCLRIDKTSCSDAHITCFNTRENAEETMQKIINRYHLCQKLCGMYNSNGACFDYTVRRCEGACIQHEEVAIYNKRIQQAIHYFEFDKPNFFIIDKGRHFKEKAVVKIENGKYIGFGYIDCSEPISGLMPLHDAITVYKDNRDVRSIIKSYLKKNNVEQILSYYTKNGINCRIKSRD